MMTCELHDYILLHSKLLLSGDPNTWINALTQGNPSNTLNGVQLQSKILQQNIEFCCLQKI